MGSNEPMDLVKWQAPNNVKVSLILHDFAFVKAYKTNHVDGDEEPLEDVSNEGKPGEPKHIGELPPFENKKDHRHSEECPYDIASNRNYISSLDCFVTRFRVRDAKPLRHIQRFYNY